MQVLVQHMGGRRQTYGCSRLKSQVADARFSKGIQMRHISMLQLLIRVVLFGAGISSPCAVAQPYDTRANTFMRSADGTVYSLNAGRLWVCASGDAVSWRPILERVSAAAVAPDGGAIFAVAEGRRLLLTKDGGARWIPLPTHSLDAELRFVFLHPSLPQVVFLGSSKGLFSSKDGGLSWTPTGLSYPVRQAYIGPDGSGVALTDDGSLHVARDIHEAWTRPVQGLPIDIITTGARTAQKRLARVEALLSADGRLPSRLFAQLEKHGLYVSDDSGSSWRPLGSSQATCEPFRAVARVGAEVILAGSCLLRVSERLIQRVELRPYLRTPDRYHGIVQFGNSGGMLVHFRYREDAQLPPRLAFFHPARGKLIGLDYGITPHSEVKEVAAALVGEQPILLTRIDFDLYISPDFGYSWEPTPITGSYKILVNPKASNEVWLFGHLKPSIYGGLNPVAYVSLDGGRNWRLMRGLQFQAENDSVYRADFSRAADRILYYSAGVNEHTIYRFHYNLDSFSGTAIDLNVPASDFVVSTDEPGALFAGLGLVSKDGGMTWQDRQQYFLKGFRPTAYRRDDVVLLSLDGARVRAVVKEPFSFLRPSTWRVVESQDLGKTWRPIAERQGEEFRKARLANVLSPHEWFVICDVPNRWSRKSSRVLKTLDGGATWSLVYSGPVAVNDVAQIRLTGNTQVLFLATAKGLLESKDGGVVWTVLGGAK